MRNISTRPLEIMTDNHNNLKLGPGEIEALRVSMPVVELTVDGRKVAEVEQGGLYELSSAGGAGRGASQAPPPPPPAHPMYRQFYEGSGPPKTPPRKYFQKLRTLKEYVAEAKKWDNSIVEELPVDLVEKTDVYELLAPYGDLTPDQKERANEELAKLLEIGEEARSRTDVVLYE